jgi:threonine/homoserine/homoserine lactone efflux protein
MAFDSKTVFGLVVILAVIFVLALVGKLTPEAVEAIKYIGSAYMGVRAVVNYAEHKTPPPQS